MLRKTKSADYLIQTIRTLLFILLQTLNTFTPLIS